MQYPVKGDLSNKFWWYHYDILLLVGQYLCFKGAMTLSTYDKKDRVFHKEEIPVVVPYSCGSISEKAYIYI